MAIKDKIDVKNLKKMIDEIELTQEEIDKVNDGVFNLNFNVKNCRNNFQNMNQVYKFYMDIYKMRYYLKLPIQTMSDYFNSNRSTMGQRLNRIGWQYEFNEAQQIAANKSRDYTQIRITGMRTRLTSLSKSNIEDYIRNKISLDLTEKLLDYDVIVGVNNLSILASCSHEVDIPIMIIKDNNIIKFAIECNGSYWHDNFSKNDESKKVLLKSKGYEVFEILQCTSMCEMIKKGVSTVDEQIQEIVNMIINIVDSK